MSLNNSSIYRTATRFKQVLIAQLRHKNDPTDFNTRATVVPLTIKAAPGQSGNLVEIQDSSDTVLWYINSSGQLVQTAAASLADPTGLGGALRMARAKYSFAVDGGVTGAITPASTAVIPDNAIIVGGTVNATAAVTSLGSATVAVGTTAGSSSSSILAATAKATLSLDAVLNAVPVFATPVKMTAAGSINITVGSADLTAGIIEVTLFYFVAAL